ncbi:hypothetical protein SOVF_057400 [Spinacia oleracea]|uniref:Uncharacterized protein LOC110785039 n=1 Tax=Spinacia oleracea TaxID=3562 RepID=A0A9R0JS75_SPIOL|nr:uncharacterized protein LOC110785039 [Spinacia oleracea]XP_056687863.1 uncharacterized protein LOC110785039 [Spinacia oleracea]KNA19874.1 hypothetical protein SOVF_057400 [Spinacia oleracea]
MENSSQSLVDFWGVITESKRIINAHSRHFLALSVLFLLPLSFSLAVFPTLLHSFTSSQPNRIVSLLRLSIHHSSAVDPPILLHPALHHYAHHKTLVFSLLFSAFILFFSLLAFASITFSVFHGFYGRPVKLISAIASLLRSFFPLLVTFIAAQIVISLIFALFGILAYLGVKGIEVIEGEFSYNSPYFYGVSSIGAILLGLVLVYVGVNWILVNVIVVVESRWGFEPMTRSSDLVRGMRWVALSLIMFFGFFELVLLWISLVSGGESIAVGDGWSTWAFAVRIVATTAILTLVLLHGIAATTVLYMYCKALHGELAGEIAHEFAADYVSLPFDDQKVPRIVCYVY